MRLEIDCGKVSSMNKCSTDSRWETETQWVCVYRVNNNMHILSFTCVNGGYNNARTYVENIVIPYHYKDNPNTDNIVLLPKFIIKYRDNEFYDNPVTVEASDI